MSQKQTREISKSELSANALQTINLASIATDAITYAMDSTESQNQINLLIDESNKMLASAQAFTIWCNKDPIDIIKQAIATIPQTMNTVYQWQRTLQLAKKSNLSVSASIFQQRINNILQNNHVNAWAKVLFDTPDAYLVAQANKWWNKAFAIGTPNDHDAYMLMINGFWTSSKYVNEFQEDLGLSLEDATHIAQIRNWQYGVPSLKDAWTLVQRGVWLKSDWLKLATLGQGFTTADADAMFELFNYVPSIGDVMSLSTLIPLDPIWVNAAFDRSGMSTADKAIFLNGLNKSIILRDIRGAWAQILALYVYGGFTEAELTTLLTGWQFPQAEIDIKIATAEMLKTKTVNGLMRDADIYLYRQGTITAGGVPSPFENGLYDRLIAQDIPTDVANAITRNEACKKGIDWELPA
jgi:hypothetical protein